LSGSDFWLKLDRVFTPPPDFSSQIEARSRNKSLQLEFEPSDSFALYIKKIIDLIRENDYSQLAQCMLEDHTSLENLRKALGVAST
jgi:hypothetical protein